MLNQVRYLISQTDYWQHYDWLLNSQFAYCLSCWKAACNLWPLLCTSLWREQPVKHSVQLVRQPATQKSAEWWRTEYIYYLKLLVLNYWKEDSDKQLNIPVLVKQEMVSGPSHNLNIIKMCQSWKPQACCWVWSEQNRHMKSLHTNLLHAGNIFWVQLISSHWRWLGLILAKWMKTHISKSIAWNEESYILNVLVNPMKSMQYVIDLNCWLWCGGLFIHY